MARPSKYNPKYHIPWAKSLAMEGKTENEIAVSMEVAPSTFKKWKKEHADFEAAVNKAKEVADAEVELSLYKRATGYSYKEKKTVVTMDKDGNQKPARIEVTDKDVIPDVTACIFWLKNRRRDKWRDNWDIDVNSDKEIIFNLVPASEKKETEDTEE